ncbi:MAG TPA: hypothetical protein VGG29_03590 [Caulobacteraceae bacterium]|jgi:hypothetical protein
MRCAAIIPISALLLLGACETPYTALGPNGGVRAYRITADTAQVTAAGNAYTDPDTVQRYALRRAAEETIDDGFDLFRIVETTDRTRSGETTFGSAIGGRYSVFGTGYTMPIVRPGESLTIKMMKGPRPDPMPDGLYDAHEVLKYLAAQ